MRSRRPAHRAEASPLNHGVTTTHGIPPIHAGLARRLPLDGERSPDGRYSRPLNPLRRKFIMTILRSLPARNLIDVHDEVNRLFDGLLAPEAGFTLQFDLPGIKPEDVKVRIHDGVLTVSGERAFSAPAGDGVRTHRRE